ncbi:MAG: AAA family ATPase [Lachnospiraceae bacterium]|nr:AAA family ATPase [Lachnospiraceae bacterium]
MADKKTVMLTNIPQMPVNRMVAELSEIYCRVIERKQPIATVPSVMLWGPPGVGKSQGVREIAKEIENRTGKRTKVTDVRLLLFNPIDLRGIPTANEDRTLAIWLRPQIFQMDDNDDIVNILFLDEISAAPQSVQAAAYQITLDRTVGEHRLPANCIVIAAGNRTTDKSVAYKMPKALANRLLHIEVETDIDSWKEWAEKSGIHPLVRQFISARHDAIMAFDSASEDLAFATPRSWEMVSGILHSMDSDVEKAFPLIAGLIGLAAATEFRTWSFVHEDLPDVTDIFEGKSPDLPRSPEVMTALVSSMAYYAKEHRTDMKLIENSIKYAERMPPDFSVMLMKSYMGIEKGYREKLMKLPVFAKWIEKKGNLLNGYI